jgi:rhodanese-related sulfurtransferase
MAKLLWAAALISWTTVAAADDGLRSPLELVAAARAEIQEISPAMLVQGAAGKVLIDVREPDEFAAGHIEGAANHPRGLLEFTVKRHPVLAALAESAPAELADTEIVLYCRSGARSALAAQSLQSLGFKRVFSLAGGYDAWRDWQAAAAE